MSKLVMYYTMGGSSRKYAEQAAKAQGCECVEIKELRKRNLLTAFIPGCPQAMNQKQPKILPLPDLSKYNEFEIYVPVWAGFPAPAFNSVIVKLPHGASVTACMVSASGESAKGAPAVKRLIAGLELKLVEYKDIRATKE